MCENPLAFKGENRGLISEAHLALIRGGYITDHFVADAERGRVIAEANGTFVLGLGVA